MNKILEKLGFNIYRKTSDNKNQLLEMIYLIMFIFTTLAILVNIITTNHFTQAFLLLIIINLFFISSYLLIKKYNLHQIYTYITPITLLLIFVADLSSTNNIYSSLLISLIFPIIVIIVNGLKSGLIYSLIMYVLIFFLKQFQENFTNDDFLKFSFALSLEIFLMLAYEILKTQSHKKNRYLMEIFNISQEQSKFAYWYHIFSSELVVWSDNLYEIFHVDKKSKNLLEAFYERIHKDHLTDIRQKINETISTKKENHFEYQIIINENELRYISGYSKPLLDENENIFGLFCLANDITDVRQKEIELAESEERYRTLIDNSSDAIMLFDLDSFKIIDVNKKTCEMFRYDDKKELIGQNPIIISPTYQPDQKLSSELAVEYLDKAIKGESQTFEWVHIDKYKQSIQCEIRLMRIPLKNKYYIRASILDITQRKELEKEKETILKELKTRNEEMESIIYVTSHDLRSPLVNIHGFSNELHNIAKDLKSLVNSDVLDKKKIEDLLNYDLIESLHYIQSSTQKMDKLLKGLLKLSRMGRKTLNLEELDLNLLMSELLDSYKFRFNQTNCQVNLKNLPEILGDKTQIIQVFSNLIDNAIKYRSTERKLQIDISADPGENFEYIYFSDNGIGIQEKHQKKVFEIFHRLNPHETIEGEGLGLTIVKRIIERHQGKIEILKDSEPGITFKIRFNKIHQNI